MFAIVSGMMSIRTVLTVTILTVFVFNNFIKCPPVLPETKNDDHKVAEELNNTIENDPVSQVAGFSGFNGRGFSDLSCLF